MYAIVRLDWKISLGIGFIFSCMAGLNDASHFEVSQGNHTSFIDTLHYVLMFIIGALLAKHRVRLSEVYNGLKKMYKIILLGIGFLAYSYSRFVPALGSKIFIELNPVEFKFIADWGITIGSAVFIVVSMSSKTVSQLLTGKMLIFNGRVSYSIYLYHTTILFLCFSILTSKLPIWGIYLVSLIFTVIATLISWKFIENPSVSLGSRLSKLVQSTKNKRIQAYFINKSR
jgi:peptidoglycan/LPS O-acetylase OafA/YrhL